MRMSQGGDQRAAAKPKAAAPPFAGVRVSEQIGQPQPDCDCYDDHNSNERKHSVRVRHSVFSQCYRANHFGFGGGMKIPNASGALPTVIVEVSAVFVAVSMIDTVPPPSFAT